MHPEEIRQRARDLLQRGLSINQTARSLGVSRASVRTWRDSPAPAPACPLPLTPGPAYAALFGFYLGDGCVSQLRRTTTLRVSCDITLPGIINDVTSVVREVHPERPVHHVRAPGVIVVQSAWKHWPCLFPQHGPGRKHERHLGMQEWQWRIVEAFPADFLRGLFHSDGARVHNWASRTVDGVTRRHDYPRWQFVNASEEILGWCGDALDLFGIAWRRSWERTLSVSRRDAVARLDEAIGIKR